MRLRPLLPALLFVLAADHASAALIGYHTTFPAPLPIPSTTQISLQGFDPALGTLTGVFIDAFIAFEGEASFTNISPDPIVTSALLRLVSTLTGNVDSERYQILDEFFVVTSGVIGPGESQVVPFDGTSGIPFVGPGTPFPAFVTPGLVLIDFYTGDFGEVGGEGFFTGVSGHVTSGFASVTYEYRPVPEPSALLLLGSGLAALVSVGRRRQPSRASR